MATLLKKPAYRAHKDDIPFRRARPSAGMNDVPLAVQIAYGTETSMMFAERGAGYHTRPHRHDAEQFNYILGGEIWFFVDGFGYRCRAGDIMRIPRYKIHWAYVLEGGEPARVIETHSLPLIGNHEEARKTSVPLLAPDEEPRFVVNEVIPTPREETEAIETRAFADPEGTASPGRPNYYVNLAKVTSRRTRPTTTPDSEFKTTQRIYGMDTSLLFADRDPGYHTHPHRHDCEQLNYILSGEIWFFVEDKAWRCRAGDIMRIPRGKVHWAWVRGNENSAVIESHAPPLPGNGPEARAAAAGLLAADEVLTDDRAARNERVDMSAAEVKRIEAAAMAEEEAALGA